jgi:predicted AAA+ superfamily ATPase
MRYKLLKFGGFPEPLFSGSERELRLWQKEKLRRLIREDVRDISDIQNLSAMESLA